LARSQSFEQAVREHGRAVYFLIISYVGNSVDADDVYQDTLREAFKYYGSFDPVKGGVFAWLRKIALHQCYRFMKQKNKRFTLSLEESMEDTTMTVQPDHAMLGKETENILWQAIQQLPTVQRVILNLTVKEELTIQQAAEELSLSKKAVESHLYRARSILKKVIEV